jgi:hypothetical protein
MYSQITVHQKGDSYDSSLFDECRCYPFVLGGDCLHAGTVEMGWIGVRCSEPVCLDPLQAGSTGAVWGAAAVAITFVAVAEYSRLGISMTLRRGVPQSN